MLEVLSIDPKRPACCAVIWLHGLGADGHDFEHLIREWGLMEEFGVRFILPHAPLRPVTLNRGMVMRAWYDIYDMDFASGEDLDGLESSRSEVTELIELQQNLGIPPDRIILAGFSQGGALALHTALRSRSPLAGVLVLSGYLPLAHLMAKQARVDPAKLVIRMDHGDTDSVVPFAAADRSCRLLEAQGYTVDFHQYAMGHTLCPEQMFSLRGWFRERLISLKKSLLT
ncbi:MAG: carboxylesterase [Thiogranum sp.]|nr:carboxylesterase [Thiogranum sp.]